MGLYLLELVGNYELDVVMLVGGEVYDSLSFPWQLNSEVFVQREDQGLEHSLCVSSPPPHHLTCH